MNRLQRDAVILSLIDNLKLNGSWCGETHIQKATYFIQELFKVPLGFEFILYKHGPFSFDLSKELTAMQADRLLYVQLQPRPYGPSLVPGDSSELIMRNFPITVNKYHSQVAFVAEQFGDKKVSELERLSTALLVTREIEPDGSPESRAQCITSLKPHVKIDEAREAVKAVDIIIEQSRNVTTT